MNQKSLIDKVRELGYEQDYYPMGGEIIYKAHEYFNAKRLGLPAAGIKIQDVSTGQICGMIWDSDPYNIDWNYHE